jgi:peptidoglycan/xylan/chitin deacetylase (PgdA/CDA1 family)
MHNDSMLLRWHTACCALALGVTACAIGQSQTGLGNAPNGPMNTSSSSRDPNAPIDAPPPPRVTGVAKPTASVSEPKLRVLPWAGFKAAITYTFDDTQPSHLEHWPALEAGGVPLTFFANPGKMPVSDEAAWKAIAAAGHEIGNHTHNHCHADLSGCSPVGSAEEEIDQATAAIAAKLGVPGVYSSAAPFGERGWIPPASSRFLVGRGVSSGFVAASGVSDWYDLPSIMVNAGDTASDFNQAIDEARAQQRWGIFLFHSILPTAHNWYAGVEIAEISASISHAKSFGDLWIDRMDEVGAYVRAQHVVEALKANDNTWTWTLPDHFPQGKVLRVTVEGGSLSQSGAPLPWDEHGYYEVALDKGSLAWTP